MPIVETILVERNHDLVARLIRDMRSFGCDVDDTDTGEKGIQLCRQVHPQLIICGSFVDRMRLWEFALEALRDNPPKAKRPLLVALTPKKDRREKALCVECGFDFYAEKPYKVLELLSWISHAREIISEL